MSNAFGIDLGGSITTSEGDIPQVPEPSFYTFLGLALCGLFMLSRRRWKGAAGTPR